MWSEFPKAFLGGRAGVLGAWHGVLGEDRTGGVCGVDEGRVCNGVQEGLQYGLLGFFLEMKLF